MVFNNNLLLGAAGQSGAFDTTLIERSAWFDGAADYLEYTPASGLGNSDWTFSTWVRRLAFGSYGGIFSARVNVNNFIQFYFTSTDKIRITVKTAGTVQAFTDTVMVFRDTSWYHLALQYDGTGSLLTLWVNGESVLTGAITSTATTAGQSGSAHDLGVLRDGGGSLTYFGKLVMAQSTLILGSAPAASTFLNTYTFGANGSQYVPKADADIAALATAAGGNSFCLTTAIGDGTDASGNGNSFTPTSMSDAANGSDNTPSLVYPVLSFIDNDGNAVGGGNFFEGNKGWQGTSAGYSGPVSTQWLNPESDTKGFYVEAKLYNATNINSNTVGLLNESFDRNPNQYLGSTAGSWGIDGYARFYAEAISIFDSTNLTTASVVQFYFEPSEGKLWIGIDDSYWNGSSLTTFSAASPSVSGLPTDQLYAFGIRGGNSGGWYMYFEEQDWTYSPPASGVPINSANLGMPDYQGIDYFNPILYTGNGSTNAITGVGFQPDLVWIKNTSSATSHSLYDAVRGVQKQLESDNTSAETTEATGLTAFGSDGFTVGSLAQVNGNTNKLMGWSWLSGGAGASNTDGSITSTVSKAAADHFSIGTYTGNATAGATIGHGLGGTPELILYKKLSGTANWIVYSEAAGAGNSDYLMLDQSGNKGFAGAINWANSTVPTATVATLGSDGNNNATAATYVFYAFRSVPGVCKIGSYTGNGSANGTFIYTGFKAAWIMIKRYNSSGAWTIFDNQREGYNVDNDELVANTTAAETTTDYVDILSNGFKLRSTDADVNASGGGYIFMAFADIAGNGDLPPIYGR